MRRSRICNIFSVILLAACSGETGIPLEEAPTGPSESSEIVLQAVDAGTGGALEDSEYTVRHLVRFPITMDQSDVERVPADEPHRIRHTTAWDSMVVEVRLEAPSYLRLDTVLVVARGSSAGPTTLRMTRHLSGGDRPAQAATQPTPERTRPANTPAAPPDPDAGIDRNRLQAGNQAYRSGDWVAATAAYLGMPEPPRPTGTYAREYAGALARLGDAHMRLGEFAGALDALESSVGYADAPYQAYLFLGQARCAVGRFDEGRASVAEIERMAPSIPPGEWGTARALAGYQRANCTYQEFQRVEAPLDLLRVGGAAIREYETFISEGEALSPIPAELSAALSEARARIEEIREKMRTG